jgi:uncharacterized protein YndB with AHSA1/START domain
VKTFDLSVSRFIAAPPKAVYAVWMDAESPGGPWYGAKHAILQLHIDGLFYFAVDHEGKSWAHYGRFLGLRPAELAQYTWMSEATRGLETIVTVAFAARDNGTEVTLRHDGIPDDDRGHDHEKGWTWILSTVAERFEEKVAT